MCPMFLAVRVHRPPSGGLQLQSIGLVRGVPSLRLAAIHSIRANISFGDWWTQVRKLVRMEQSQTFDSLVILVVWTIWLHNNNRVFGWQVLSEARLVALVVSLSKEWCPLLKFNDFPSVLSRLVAILTVEDTTR
jgi:hypothetical protein